MVIAFYIFAILAVLSAFNVILLRSPVYCAISLVACFFFLGVIYIILNSEFVAAVQILVYAGAIMVLFLFVIMLLNLRTEQGATIKFGLGKILGIGLTVGLLAQMVGVFTSPAARLGPKGAYSEARVAEEGSIEIIGELLFTDYVLPFEVISVLLMVAVMGAVLLAKKQPPPDAGEER